MAKSMGSEKNTTMSKIPNILAERYASKNLLANWTPEVKIKLERAFWIAVMKAQSELGLKIPAQAIKDYECVRDDINLESIRQREIKTRHDVKARIDEFNDLAGHEHIHKGLTSRDLTENIEQLQIYSSIEFAQRKTLIVLYTIAEFAKKYRNIIMAARTHNVPAQLTTLGRKFAMFGEELLHAVNRFVNLVNNYAFRGIKGAVGTQQDLLQLFDNDSRKMAEFEQKILIYLKAPHSLKNTGQVYSRSLDFDVVSGLYQLAAAINNIALNIRLMAGIELLGEGFAKGQTGSSAMPHKMNTRSCERINGFHTILKGYLSMASDLAGNQWNEGDVSCSVVRRVLFPDCFFAYDGMLETILTVLKQLNVYSEVIKNEVEYYLPFLATTRILMEAVKNELGRETAHATIKEQALEVMNDLRAGKIINNDLIDRLAKKKELGLNSTELERLINEAKNATGMADNQITDFLVRIEELKERFPLEISYEPESIL